MCCLTDGGIVDFFGKIRIRPNRFSPIVLPELHYIVYNDSDDTLQLKYRPVCVELEVASKATTIDEAIENLKMAINHYIDLAIKDFGREKAYSTLMEERKERLDPKNVDYVSYYQAEEHTYNKVNTEAEIKHYRKLLSMPYYSDLVKRLIFIAHVSKIYASRVETL